MAWIPIFDIYLLGKLTINKLVGWALVICAFLTSTYTTTINGVESSGGILPEGIRNVVSIIYGFVVLGLFIYAIVKYNKLKKEKVNGVSQQNVYQQPIQNMNNGVSMQPTSNSVSNNQQTPPAAKQPQSIGVDQSIQNVQPSQVPQPSIPNENQTINDINMSQLAQPTGEQSQNPINTNINNNNGL